MLSCAENQRWSVGWEELELAVVEVEALFELTVPSWDLTRAVGEEHGLLVYRLETRVQLAGDPKMGAEVVNEARLETVERTEGLLE